ncbi:hypothetical protein M9Y10_001625 [Tritrichomonas musculus]|uniref:Uncharacterized protein n=1 Tax=Tritrichomonas musculus TaxID=1915356 RepID=A0ABR2L989_9EUKA
MGKNHDESHTERSDANEPTSLENDQHQEASTTQNEDIESQDQYQIAEPTNSYLKKQQKSTKAIKSKEKISPFLQPPFPPHSIRPPPKVSKSQYKKHEALPPLLSTNDKRNDYYADTNDQEDNNQKNNCKQNESQKSNEYIQRTAFLDKKNKMYAQALHNNYSKNIPLDSYKENQSEKWMNMSKKSTQMNAKKHHYRQTYKLPPMETNQEDPMDSNEHPQSELPDIEQSAENLASNANVQDNQE